MRPLGGLQPPSQLNFAANRKTPLFKEITMSQPHHAPAAQNSQPDYTHGHAPDAVENIVSSMPIVLPLVGAVLIFLLAFIAVNMA